MATLKAELREILTKYGIDPRDKTKLWDCHGTLVLYHRAYEIIAARERITFDAPVIIEANSADKIVALLVTGRMGERVEWSIGEAAPGNCKNAYVYAIAEKRAKDRVIAKLVGLAEYVYSEDEADEFKDGPRQAAEPAAPPADARSAPPPSQPPASRTALQAATSAPLPVNPEEPPQIAQARREAMARFWTRDDYGISPDVIQGGLVRWDTEFLTAADAAPTLDCLAKLKTDNKDAGYVARWEAAVKPEVIRHFRQRCAAIETRLSQQERAA